MPAKQRRIQVVLPPETAKRIRAIAKQRKISESRAVMDLVDVAFKAEEERKERFKYLTDRLISSTDGAEIERVKLELGTLMFGEACQ